MWIAYKLSLKYNISFQNSFNNLIFKIIPNRFWIDRKNKKENVKEGSGVIKYAGGCMGKIVKKKPYNGNKYFYFF